MSDAYQKAKAEGFIPATSAPITPQQYKERLGMLGQGGYATAGFLRPVVLIESPFRNEPMAMHYLGVCVKDAIARGEAPIASHGFYPRWLDDADPEQRETGFDCWRGIASIVNKVVIYHDLGISEGMRYALSFCNANRINIEFRALGDEWRKGVTLVPKPTAGAPARPESPRPTSGAASSGLAAGTK